jgi:hypothetical protein
MKNSNIIKQSLVAATISLSFMSSSALAGAIIKYGDTFLGVNNEGHLNIAASDEGLTIPDGFIGPAEGTSFFGRNPENIPIGLYRNGLGDATSPGCLCEGWGVAATLNAGAGTRVSGFASGSIVNGGIGGLTGGSFGSTDSTATSQVTLTDADDNISVTHSFGPSLAEGVFQVSVSIRNNTGSAIDDLVYRRAMDWDIPPTEFREFVTHGGVEVNLESAGGNIRHASDGGFSDVDPLQSPSPVLGSTVNVDFEDNGPNDHGSVFDFAFGQLADGERRTFNIFYGSAANEAEALGAIATLGVNAYSLGQSSGDGGFGGDDGGDFGGDFEGDFPSVALAASTGEAAGPESGEPATFLFAFGGVGGIEPGSSEDTPLLPFVPAPGVFEFVSPEPRQWFDPPFADGFEYALAGGATFTSITLPSAGLGFGTIDVVVDGIVVATLTSEDAVEGGIDTYVFGAGVSTFSLVGLDMELDVEDPAFATAFPVFLDFSGTADLLTQTALIIDDSPDPTPPPTGVSAPASMLLLSLGLAIMGIRRRKRA